MDYYISVLKKYAVFSGRARRAEYWYFFLFNLIISIGLSIVSTIISDKMGILGLLYALAVLLPSIGVTIRRLHDTNHSGWWWFIVFIPVIGIIVLLVFLARDSQSGDNQYGSNPKEVATV